jgi:hypothetical protein
VSSEASLSIAGKEHRPLTSWNWLPACFAFLVSGVVGCNGPETARVPLVRVSGVVTLDGDPLENAIVVFESEDGSYSYAQTDSLGHYDLKFDSQYAGVTLGQKAVRISMNRRIRGLNSNDEGGPGDTAGGSFEKQPKERIPEKYNLRSILSADVTASSKTFDFDLESD